MLKLRMSENLRVEIIAGVRVITNVHVTEMKIRLYVEFVSVCASLI